jgi:hypothetical protein
MNGGLSGLLRYWWVLVIGLAVGIGVAIVASYAKDEPYSYSAETRILVTSADAPYYRTEVTNTVERDVPTSPEGSVVVETSAPPDFATLVRSANLYPQLVESDLVARYRDSLYGPLPGTVNSKTLFSFEGANRFEESSIPVLQIVGTAPTQTAALNIADKTTRAFIAYVQQQQQDAGIAANLRTVLQPLTAARLVATTGGPVYGIPGLLGIAVFLGFCGLALLLDAYSRRSRATVAALSGAPAPSAVPTGHEQHLAS